MNRIEEIKERVSKLINIPWKTTGEYSTDYYKPGYDVETEKGLAIAECIDSEEEADFIASAPTDIQHLLSKLEIAEKAIEQLGRMDDPRKIEEFADQALAEIRQ